MYEFIEILNKIELVKVLTYHRSVLAMRYLEVKILLERESSSKISNQQQEKLVTVGSEGRVRMWTVQNDLDCVWTKDLLWNNVSAAMFLSDTDILLGTNSRLLILMMCFPLQDFPLELLRLPKWIGTRGCSALRHYMSIITSLSNTFLAI